MQKSVDNKKTFSYVKGNTNLNFTLNVDVKSEMQDFAEILKQSLIDVEAQIAALSSK